MAHQLFGEALLDAREVDGNIGREHEEPIHGIASERHRHLDPGVRERDASASRQQIERPMEARSVGRSKQLLRIGPATSAAEFDGKPQRYIEVSIVRARNTRGASVCCLAPAHGDLG